MHSDTDHYSPVFRILRDSRNTAADAALVEALTDLHDDARRTALEILLNRANESALVMLVARYRGFNTETQDLIAEHIGQLGGALRHCVDATDTESRLSAIELINRATDYRSAYLLAKASGNRCAKTGRYAAETLLKLSKKLSHEFHKGRIEPTSANHLTEGLHQALHVWPVHFRSEILKAAMIMCEWFEEEFLNLASNPRGKLLRGFENHMIAASDDFPPRFFYVAMRSTRLAPSAASLLIRAKENLAREILDCSWMLGDPRIADGCARTRIIRSISDAWVDGAGDSKDSQMRKLDRMRSVIRLVSACGASCEQKTALLGKLVLGSQKQIAREAFWALRRVNGPESDQILQTLASRNDDPLTPFARLEIEQRGPQLHAVAPVSNPARMPSRGPSSSFEAFHDFWNQFEDINPEQRASIGNAMFKSSPEYIHLLRSKLGSGNAAENIKALRVIDECAEATAFADSLYGHARHVDATVRAKSVELLGRISTSTSRRILLQALNDVDQRVQASAVEAISQLRWPDRAQVLTPMLKSQHRRVQGNTIKALLPLRVRSAAIALVNLLHSNDSQDRLTGIWVAGELGLGSVMSTLEQLAEGDPDPTVRRRARSAMQGAASEASHAISGAGAS